MLKAYIMKGWLHTKYEVELYKQMYWPIRHELAMVDDFSIKGK